MNNSIDVKMIKELENPIIVDIREYYYYSIGHISGAKSIPYYNLLNNYNHYLEFDKIYYLYCEKGEQSKELVDRLNSFGYHTFNITGGYQEYLKLFI